MVDVCPINVRWFYLMCGLIDLSIGKPINEKIVEPFINITSLNLYAPMLCGCIFYLDKFVGYK
jgi:hypothetical protein